jgi:hypothetical protein
MAVTDVFASVDIQILKITMYKNGSMEKLSMEIVTIFGICQIFSLDL